MVVHPLVGGGLVLNHSLDRPLHSGQESGWDNQPSADLRLRTHKHQLNMLLPNTFGKQGDNPPGGFLRSGQTFLALARGGKKNGQKRPVLIPESGEAQV